MEDVGLKWHIPESSVLHMGAACTGLIKTPAAIAMGKAAVGPYVKDEVTGKVASYLSARGWTSVRTYLRMEIELAEKGRGSLVRRMSSCAGLRMWRDSGWRMS
ncbi:MAG: hypothetical protein HPY71_03825 [Firmicutes bacterium]|nr:hypothetical protein [Bacillota bacterium]